MAAETGVKEVAVGGTFDPIHDGHRALFDEAFRQGNVTIGLTSDALATKIRPIDRPVQPYAQRRLTLARELSECAKERGRSFRILKLHSPTGIADNPKFDVLVVSPETEPTAQWINDIRQRGAIPPLEIVVVDHVRAEDGDIISSTRILAGEIDQHGAVIAK